MYNSTTPSSSSRKIHFSKEDKDFYNSYELDFPPFINKYLQIVNDNIISINRIAPEEFNISTKDRSGYINLPLKTQTMIFKILDLTSEENKILPIDIKKIIFQKLLDSMINTSPTGVTRYPLYRTLVFRNIIIHDIDFNIENLSSDSDDSDSGFYSLDDEDWYRGDE